jgi:hypothetical protein
VPSCVAAYSCTMQKVCAAVGPAHFT